MKLFRALVGGPSMWSVGIWPKPAVQHPLRDVVVREARSGRQPGGAQGQAGRHAAPIHPSPIATR